MIKFVLGRAASGKTTYLMDTAKVCCAQGKKVCLIVPEQESMMTERTCQERYGDGVHVLSFHRLGDTLMRLYGGGAKARIGEVATLGILYRAVQSVKRELRYYRKSAGSVRFYEKLLPVMEDFAAYKAQSDVILPLLENTSMYDKYRDLFLIYDAYRALRQQDFRDQFDDLETVCALLKQHPYFENKVVLIDHFAGFTQQEYAILEQIFLQADDVSLTLTADKDEPSLFAPTLRHYRRLIRLCDSMGLAWQTTGCNGLYRFAHENLKVLEQYLFSASRPKALCESDGSVRIFSLSDTEQEVRAVAADIRRKVLSGECRYKDISVVSNVQQEYQHLVEMVFDELDIPLYTDRKVDVLSRPLFSMILHAFDVVEYGFRFEDIISFAKTGLCGLDFEQVAKLENYVYIWNIRGKKWEMEWTQSPFGLEEGDARQKALLLQEINEYRAHLVAPLVEFREDTASGKATDLLSAMWRLTQNFAVTDELKKLALEQRDRQQAEQWIRLYDLLIEVMDQLALVLGESTVSRKEMHDMLEVCLRNYRFGVVPAFMDQVRFGDMVRAGNTEVKHLYVLGASAGKFPSNVSGSNMITDQDIRHFEQKQILLSKDSISIAGEQQFCLYRSICSASESVTFSYAGFAADGSAQLPSSLMGRITKKLISLQAMEQINTLTHKKDLLDLVMTLPEKDEEYIRISAFLKENFDIDTAALRTQKTQDKALPQSVVEALYGKELSASQSRLESFVGCPFKFFLDYGLKIKETEPVTFAANYIGDFVHFGMERLMNEISADGDALAWDEKRVDEVMESAAKEYYETNLRDMSSARFDHLFDRISRTMKLCGRSALNELQNSSFFPKAQEYHFEQKIPLSNGFYAKINGFIDRVDTAQICGEKWLKIVDYKTGNKSFDLEKIYNGYQLQLPLYTKMLQQIQFPDARVAAMEYFLAGVPLFESESENVLEDPQTLAQAFKRKGLFIAEPEIVRAIDKTDGLYHNAPIKKDGSFYSTAMVADRAQMQQLCDFAVRKTREIMEQMVSGDVSVCPMKQGSNACEYCSYEGICRFEYGKNKVKEYHSVGGGEFFDKISEEEEK